MKTNFDNYLFRCSSLGRIVTKSGDLTQDAQTYLEELFISVVYGVEREIYGKQLDKGIICEPEGRRMLNLLYPERFVKKNEERKKNEYIIGTHDVIMDDIVWDIKNAWDLLTFGKAKLSHIYLWQLKGYCFLEKLTKGKLFYCLNNMPEYMVADEERKMFYFQRKWATMEDPEYTKACEELRAAHNYDKMPLQDRFKIFDVSFTKADEEKIIACVKQAREYLNGLLKSHNERIDYNLSLMSVNV